MKAACCEFRNRGVAGRIAFYLALIALPKTVNAKPLKHATHFVVAELEPSIRVLLPADSIVVTWRSDP